MSRADNIQAAQQHRAAAELSVMREFDDVHLYITTGAVAMGIQVSESVGSREQRREAFWRLVHITGATCRDIGDGSSQAEDGTYAGLDCHVYAPGLYDIERPVLRSLR